MEYLKIYQVIEANKTGVQPAIDAALRRLEKSQKNYPRLITAVMQSNYLREQIDATYEAMAMDPNARPESSLAVGAGAYFLNENIIAGSREASVVENINRLGTQFVPGWQTQDQKIKLGPGIGFVEAPKVYRELIGLGLRKADLTVNYTAPFGNAETSNGIKKMMDSRIDPEGSYFPENGTFLTQGATEAIDLFMEAMSVVKPKSRIVFLGLSYYTGPYSAIQKDLVVDRLIANPLKQNGKTRFFPIAEEVKKSLPKDTSAVFLTSPNNPNGEVYPEAELRELIRFLKKENIFVLFDALFENMFFDRAENYQSRILQIANELGALDIIAVIDGISKTKNFPGERIGFLATTNQELATTLTNIVLARRCNPRLILGPLVQFEGLARQVQTIMKRSPSTKLRTAISQAMGIKEFPFNRNVFERKYKEWQGWEQEVLKFYQDNLALTRAILDSSIDAASPDQAAFNTFVKLKGLNSGTNCIDFLAKFMFTTATYTQIGPCFGVSQEVWDQQLGVWPRITYACGRKDLVEGLARLKVFSRVYEEEDLGNPSRFPVLDVNYRNQV